VEGEKGKGRSEIEEEGERGGGGEIEREEEEREGEKQEEEGTQGAARLRQGKRRCYALNSRQRFRSQGRCSSG